MRRLGVVLGGGGVRGLAHAGVLARREIGQRAFAEQRLTHADVVLRREFGEPVPLLDFSAVQEVVRRGVVSAGRAAADIHRLLTA